MSQRVRTFPSRQALGRMPFGMVDVVVLAGIFLLLFAVVWAGRGMVSSFTPSRPVRVSTDPAELPYYALRSAIRMFVALFFSVVFTLGYGYLAAKSRRAEKVLVPALDILQSVPVLGFLSVTVTGFIALFPHSMLGLECASIFAIFTAQAWNMTFSFYHSVRALPRELDELSRMLRLTRWQRFWKIEVPNSIVGLVWNGMMSFGGAWFFLAASESISVLNHDYQLPGVGSFAAEAIRRGNLGGVVLAIVTMAFMVVAINFLFWRPITAWAERFKVEEAEAAEVQRSWVLEVLRRSIFASLAGSAWAVVTEPLGRMMRILGRDGEYPSGGGLPGGRKLPGRTGDFIFAAFVLLPIAYGIYRMADYVLRGVGLGGLGGAFLLGAFTLGRVFAVLVFATLVWVPVGVWIGLNPRVARLAQPLIQVLASFPANLLFPFATLLFLKYGISLNLGGILLMALGSQWYILFNTIAGAMAIPTDLREAAEASGLRRWKRWRYLILPGIFPAYVTGGITAAGGAWNASIVAEVVRYGGTTLTASGLGAYITRATATGQWPQILTGVAVMSLYVVAFNRLLWRRLYALAETRYSL
nr:ABC transporter permease subunit [Rubrobacter calidifluminis]